MVVAILEKEIRVHDSMTFPVARSNVRERWRRTMIPAAIGAMVALVLAFTGAPPAMASDQTDSVPPLTAISMAQSDISPQTACQYSGYYNHPGAYLCGTTHFSLCGLTPVYTKRSSSAATFFPTTTTAPAGSTWVGKPITRLLRADSGSSFSILTPSE
jgi:hypothetical protein